MSKFYFKHKNWPESFAGGWRESSAGWHILLVSFLCTSLVLSLLPAHVSAAEQSHLDSSQRQLSSSAGTSDSSSGQSSENSSQNRVDSTLEDASEQGSTGEQPAQNPSKLPLQSSDKDSAQSSSSANSSSSDEKENLTSSSQKDDAQGNLNDSSSSTPAEGTSDSTAGDLSQDSASQAPQPDSSAGDVKDSAQKPQDQNQNIQDSQSNPSKETPSGNDSSQQNLSKTGFPIVTTATQVKAGLTIEGKEAQNGMLVKDGESFTLALNFSLPEDLQQALEDIFTYPIPQYLQAPDAGPYSIIGDDDEAVGDYQIKNNQVICQFNQNYLEHRGRQISLLLHGVFDIPEDYDQETISVNLPGGPEYTFAYNSHARLKLAKTGTKVVDVNTGLIFADYTLQTSASVLQHEIVITDHLNPNGTLLADSLHYEISGGASQPVFSQNGQDLLWTIEEMPNESQVIISYRVQLKSTYGGLNQQGMTYTNTASAKSSLISEQIAQSTIQYHPMGIQKTGSVNASAREVSWTYQVRPGDFSQFTVQDQLMDTWQIEPDGNMPIDIYCGNALYQTITWQQFKNGYTITGNDPGAANIYRITFKTRYRENTPEETLLSNRGLIKESGEFVTAQAKVPALQPSIATSKVLESYDEKKDILNWKITWQVSKEITSPITLLDVIGSNQSTNNRTGHTIVPGSGRLFFNDQLVDPQRMEAAITYEAKRVEINCDQGLKAGTYVLLIQTTYDRIQTVRAYPGERSLQVYNGSGWIWNGREFFWSTSATINACYLSKQASEIRHDQIIWEIKLENTVNLANPLIGEQMPEGLRFVSAAVNQKELQPVKILQNTVYLSGAGLQRGDVIRVVTEISDYAALQTSKTFTNTAFMETDGQAFDQVTASAQVDPYQTISKSVVYNQHTAPFSHYLIDLNPDGLQIHNGQPYSIEDIIPDTMAFVPGSLLVNGQSHDNCMIQGNQLIIADLPDEQPLTIAYICEIHLEAGSRLNQANATNTASLHQFQFGVSSAEASIQSDVFAVQGSANTNKWRVTVFKMDSSHMGLPGAELTLYNYGNSTVPSDHPTIERVWTTDESGYTEPVWLELDTIYKIVETKVPEGYVGQAETGYFVRPSKGSHQNYGDGIHVYRGYNSLLICLMNDSKTKSLQIKKVWEDENDQDGHRPNSIVIKAVCDQSSTSHSITLTAANNWQGQLNHLPSYIGGKKANWSLVEQEVPGYTSQIHEELEQADGTQSFLITNFHEPEVQDLTYTKVWHDRNNQDGIRPQSVHVRLMYEGKVVQEADILEKDDWKVTFTSIPVYQNGKPATYTIEEDPVEGYTALYADNKIINTHEPAVYKPLLTKQWKDDDNRDGLRPDQIQVKIFADGQYVQQVLLSRNENWQTQLPELPVYQNGEKITYTLEELPAESPISQEEDGTLDTEGADTQSSWINSYSVSYDLQNSASWLITNTHEPALTSISGRKIWRDNDNQDGKRPDQVTVRLRRDGAIVRTQVVSAANDWNYEFKNLHVYERGHKVEYVVSEDEVAEYQVSLDGYNLVNTYTPEKTQILVYKLWDDRYDQDGIRPAEVRVRLYQNGKPTDQTKIISAATYWGAAFNELPVRENGKIIKYSIREESMTDLPDLSGRQSAGIQGYTTKFVKIGHHFLLVNFHLPKTREIQVIKRWEDADNQDGKRPDQLQVKLHANGVEITEATLTAADSWMYSFKRVPVFWNGSPIDYTLSEESVEGYSEQGSWNESKDTYTFINSHLPETRSIGARVEWEDDQNQDGLRPQSLELKLVPAWQTNPDSESAPIPADPSTSDEESTEKEANGFNPLPNAPDSAPATDTPGQKETAGASSSSAFPSAPSSETLNPPSQLPDGQVQTVDAADHWQVFFSDVPLYQSGYPLDWSLSAPDIPGYEKQISGSEQTGYVVQYLHTSARKNIEVEVEWHDDNNQAGLRPDQVIVELYAHTETEQKEILIRSLFVKADEGWKNMFKQVPVYQDGEPVLYMIHAEPTADYHTQVYQPGHNPAAVQNETFVVVKTYESSGADSGGGGRPDQPETPDRPNRPGMDSDQPETSQKPANPELSGSEQKPANPDADGSQQKPVYPEHSGSEQKPATPDADASQQTPGSSQNPNGPESNFSGTADHQTSTQNPANSASASGNKSDNIDTSAASHWPRYALGALVSLVVLILLAIWKKRESRK